MNPAVTLAFAFVRRLDWIKVPVYCIAQLFGAFLASAVVYGIYYGRTLHNFWYLFLSRYLQKISVFLFLDGNSETSTVNLVSEHWTPTGPFLPLATKGCPLNLESL